MLEEEEVCGGERGEGTAGGTAVGLSGGSGGCRAHRVLARFTPNPFPKLNVKEDMKAQ